MHEDAPDLQDEYIDPETGALLCLWRGTSATGLEFPDHCAGGRWCCLVQRRFWPAPSEGDPEIPF